jgi:hypothetical protein
MGCSQAWEIFDGLRLDAERSGPLDVQAHAAVLRIPGGRPGFALFGDWRLARTIHEG